MRTKVTNLIVTSKKVSNIIERKGLCKALRKKKMFKNMDLTASIVDITGDSSNRIVNGAVNIGGDSNY